MDIKVYDRFTIQEVDTYLKINHRACGPDSA